MILAPVLLSAAMGAAPPSAGAARAAADSDAVAIATAMDILYLDTGYYSTIENLDDVSTVSVVNHWEWILDGGGTLVIPPSEGLFKSTRVDLVTGGYLGPYLTVVRKDDEFSEYDPGTPLDPWFRPYYFFTPLGMVQPLSESVTLDLWGDTFDRYAIVSLGHDGVKSDDDVIRTFGGAITTFQISSARIVATPARSGFELRVKGYNFGATQGTGAVLENGSDMAAATTWSATLVTVPLAALPSPGTTYAIRRGNGAVSRALGYIDETTAEVPGWEMY